MVLLYVKHFAIQKAKVLWIQGRVVWGNMSAQESGLSSPSDQHTTYLGQNGTSSHSVNLAV